MKTLHSEHKLCISCMEEHNVDTVEIEEQVTFKDIKVKFSAIYEHCTNTDEYTETENMIRANGLAVKDAYRKDAGLLTSYEIKGIREKYNISQKEFSQILGWGKATITRYENHQVQERAHDDILRKIDSDPKWFMELLERSKNMITPKLYMQYFKNISDWCIRKDNPYQNSLVSKSTSFVVRSINDDKGYKIDSRDCYSNSRVSQDIGNTSILIA